MLLPGHYLECDADKLVYILNYIVKEYGVLTVEDVYDLCESENPLWERPSNDYTDTKRGWPEAYIKIDTRYENGGVVIELNEPIAV